MKNSLRIMLIIVTVYACSFAGDKALKDVFKNNYKIGTAVNRLQLTQPDSASLAFIKKHFNSITTENDLKWEKVHPEKDTYDFAPAERFMDLGRKNNMYIILFIIADWLMINKQLQSS